MRGNENLMFKQIYERNTIFIIDMFLLFLLYYYKE